MQADERRFPDFMGVSCGRITDGDATTKDMGWELLGRPLDVAGGRKRWTERWNLANSVVLFKPAPLT